MAPPLHRPPSKNPLHLHEIPCITSPSRHPLPSQNPPLMAPPFVEPPLLLQHPLPFTEPPPCGQRCTSENITFFVCGQFNFRGTMISIKPIKGSCGLLTHVIVIGFIQWLIQRLGRGSNMKHEIYSVSFCGHFYCPPTKLRESNVHSCVCLSVCLSTGRVPCDH